MALGSRCPSTCGIMYCEGGRGQDQSGSCGNSTVMMCIHHKHRHMPTPSPATKVHSCTWSCVLEQAGGPVNPRARAQHAAQCERCTGWGLLLGPMQGAGRGCPDSCCASRRSPTAAVRLYINGREDPVIGRGYYRWSNVCCSAWIPQGPACT